MHPADQPQVHIPPFGPVEAVAGPAAHRAAPPHAPGPAAALAEGLKLAEKNNLPKVIKDFITTHHGRGKTKYFYIAWKNEHPGEDPNEEAFTYPGPNPFTKEQAILMMADSVEAASRSLPEYTEESISNLVDRIIDSQVAEGYFNECTITFKDIATVKYVFKEKMTTIYHTRICYTELKQ